MTSDTLTLTAQEHGPALTPDHIRALRTGDSYVVRLDGGKATLDVTRELPTPPGFSRSGIDRPEARITFNVGADSTVTATWVLMYGHPGMRALALMVRPGDILRFHARVNNSGYLDAACIPAGAMNERYHAAGYPKLYAEELIVTILRPVPTTGKVRCVTRDLLLAYTVVPDNSARNIRAS